MPKYYSHGMAPYVYDWPGRAYGANQQNSMVRSELGGLIPEGLVLPIIGAIGLLLIYPKIFGSSRVRTVKR